MKRFLMAAAVVVVIVATVAAANQMYQLEIYEWLRFRDDTLITFGTADDFYGLYASADDQLELRSGNDGELLVVVDHDGLGLPADLDIAGQLEAGSGNHTLTNAAGLIDGGKIQDGTIMGAQVYATGLPDGAIFYVDTEAWTAGAMSGHGTLDGDGVLTIQTYTWDSGGTEGLVPDAVDGTTDRFLCVDGTWSVPSIGAVGGPGSSTDNAVMRWDGTDGDTAQNSLVIITDGGAVTIPGTLTVGSGAHLWSNTAGLIDGGKLQDGTVTTLKMAATAVVPGSYTVTSLTVDASGRITAASSGTLGLIELDDGESDYSGAGGYPIVVNSTQDGWEFASELDPAVLPVFTGDSGSGGVQGAVPAPGVGDTAAGKYLFADGTWATPSGTGNVAGPGTSTDTALALYDGVDGQLLQDSNITSADGDSLTIPGTITAGSGANVLTNSAGLIDGGKIQAGSVGIAAVDIATGTTESTADDDDLILIYDDTATANRVMTRAHFLSGISGGDSLWTDSGTYIEADNTADVRIYDDGEAIRLSIPAINTDNLSSESVYGIFVNHYSQGANANSYVYGVKGHAVAETGATGTNDDYVGVSGAGYALGESTIADRIVGLLGEVSVTTLAAANSAYCIYAAPAAMSGSATSVYGLAIGDIDDGTTNNYAIHTGAGDVRLGDDVHIVGNLTVDGTYPGGGVTDFTDLGDVPSAYTDQAGKFVKVNATADGLEFATGTAATFGEIVLRPRDSDPALVSYATFDARNNHTVLDFDADSDEIAYWNSYLPAAYGSGGITVEIHYAMTSATSGNAVWTAAFENLADEEQDLDSDGFASAKSVTQAVSDTSGKVKRATISFSDGAEMDSVGAGDIFRLQITRDANNASDTATGDAELLLVIIKETSS